MTAYRLFGLLGFALGLMLYLSLLTALFRRRLRARGETVLTCLFAALCLWLMGNSLTFFFELLFSGRDFQQVARWPFFKVFDFLSGLGMLLTPPLLVHTIAAQLPVKTARPNAPDTEPDAYPQLRGSFMTLLGATALMLFYLPLSFFLPSIIFLFHSDSARLLTHRATLLAGSERTIEIANSETSFIARDLRYLLPYLGYLLLASLACTLLTRIIMRRRRLREDKLYYRTCYRAFWLMNTAMIIVVAACMVLAFAMPGTFVEPTTSRALKIFSLLASIGPGAILAAYVYRYNYMSLNLWKKPLYIGCALLAAIIGLQGFNLAGPWIENVLKVNLVLVEVTVVALIVALLRPAHALVRRTVARFVTRREDQHRRRLAEISEQLNAPSIFTLSQMFDFVVAAVKQAFNVSRVVLLAYRRSELGHPLAEIHASNLSRTEHIATSTILSFLGEGRRKYLDTLTCRNPQLIEEIRALRCQLVFPLARGGQVVGLLGIGRSSTGNFVEGEIEMLGILASQVSTAVENMMLVDDKVNLRQKMLESEKLLSLGRLSASVAHEVKNPLSAIKTLTQVVQEDLPKDSPLQKDLAMIRSEIDRLNNVVNRLLEFARPSKTPEVPINIEDVVDSVVTVLRHEAARKQVEIAIAIDPDMPPMRLNVESVKEILFNLILNGIQAIEGSGRVSVSTSIVKENNGETDGGNENRRLQIVVADTGPGIEPDKLDRIFEPFFTTKAVGTGLGLAIVSQKVTDLGGDIGVLNDGGARFIIKIPFHAVPLKPDAPLRAKDGNTIRK
jgi:signal transduction histidine kinase